MSAFLQRCTGRNLDQVCFFVFIDKNEENFHYLIHPIIVFCDRFSLKENQWIIRNDSFAVIISTVKELSELPVMTLVKTPCYPSLSAYDWETRYWSHPCQVLWNRDILMRRGLLEQGYVISAQEMRTENCWNANTHVTRGLPGSM